MGIYSTVLLLFYSLFSTLVFSICFCYFKALVFFYFVYTNQSLIILIFACGNISFFQTILSGLEKMLPILI